MHTGTPRRPPSTADAVLVFGATGQQGRAVTTALLAAGASVRALVRDPASDAARALASRGVTLFRGDFSDVASIRAAMAGARGVFSVQPNSGSAGSEVTDADEVRFGKRIADLAAENDVQHLVYTSAGIISQGRTGLGNLDCKLEIEAHVRRLDIASTIVRPATFMELLALPGMGLEQGTFSFFLRPEQVAQFVAVEDIGRVVATVFADPARFAGRTLELAGDEVSGLGLQDALSHAAGRPIVYRRFSDTVLRDNLPLRRNAALFDAGRGAGNADIPALEHEFGHLRRLPEWLAGPGRALFQSALASGTRPVAMR